ncbi:MAG: phage head-tail connector protein [Roseovarius sp.]
MKMLVDRAGNAAQPFDLDALKAHLRVEDDSEDAAIQIIGRAAAAEIEQFAQVALLTQTITVTIFDPSPTIGGGLRLPVGPVASDATLTVTIDGAALTAFDFAAGPRPYLRWQDEYFDLTPDQIVIEYEAGFGAAATDVPSDLAQALMDQAALHYDGRSPMDAKSLTTSPHMARIGARYRGVQL